MAKDTLWIILFAFVIDKCFHGAVIDGILGACFILAVSAVLIVCKIRSKRIFQKSDKCDNGGTIQLQCSKSNYQDSNNTSERTSAIPTTNQTYGLDETSTAVYAVVNKLKKPENIKETYIDAAYGEYDHLNDIQNRMIGLQENVYNSHGAYQHEDYQTYDSSNFGNAKCNKGSDIYDKSFSVVVGDYS
ncbi:unnamed protein product [Mytilus coruscus]|uniref:Uncharacterized protein n=1 Tax=Mytilus coruscus TaxID=42192 RepID=A0A6J8DXT9_MYTCO|nr:unnamed protein product [Mytilus coruscus]